MSSIFSSEAQIKSVGLLLESVSYREYRMDFISLELNLKIDRRELGCSLDDNVYFLNTSLILNAIECIAVFLYLLQNCI